MTYNIRHLSIKDIDIYKSIRLEALKNNPEAFGATYEEEILYSDEDFRKLLVRLDIFGAFFEERIVGIIGFKAETMQKVSHNGELVSMYITPDFRNIGVGSALINHAIRHAQNQVSQLCLHCITDNQALVRFYEKQGFTIIGVYPKGMKLGDKYYDTAIMFQFL